MEETTTMFIHDGYILDDEWQKIPREKAIEYLFDNQKSISFASKSNDYINIAEVKFTCPHCGASEKIVSKEYVDEQVIEDWLNSDDDKILVLNKFRPVCSKCGVESMEAVDGHMVTINEKDEKIIVTVDNINCFDACIYPEEPGCGTFVKETVVFDFEKGTISTVAANDSDVIFKEELNDIPQNSFVFYLLKTSVSCREELYDAFQNKWGEVKLPFAKGINDINWFIRCCQFIGYDEAFYNHIPYGQGRFSIPEEFKTTAEQMQNKENLKIPHWASDDFLALILMKQKPYLLFYIDILEELYKKCIEPEAQAIQLVHALRLESAVYVLKWIKEHPLVADFIKDYSGKKGFFAAWTAVGKQGGKQYALHYSTLNRYLKKLEQEKWTDKNWSVGISRPQERYYSYRLFNYLSIGDCLINGFSFVSVNTSARLFSVQDELKLRQNYDSNFDYCAVYKADGTLLALIVIKPVGTVHKVFADGYALSNKQFRNAYGIWLKENNLKDPVAVG